MSVFSKLLLGRVTAGALARSAGRAITAGPSGVLSGGPSRRLSMLSSGSSLSANVRDKKHLKGWVPLAVSSRSRSSPYGGSATILATADNCVIRMDPPRIHISRLMAMEDTQMFGLVHGCTQLQLVEDAGTTLTSEFCNAVLRRPDDEDSPKKDVRTMSGCLERADFIRPMLAGDIAEVDAEITYTSSRSMQVTASVYARNREDGSRYKTVDAKMWFVPKASGEDSTTTPTVPQLKAALRPDGVHSYETLKSVRDALGPRDFDRPYRPDPLLPYNMRPEDVQPFTPDFSRCRFLQPIHPVHCVPGEKYSCGGVVLRQMDEAGALAAVGHCNYYSFTSYMDWVVFHRKISVGTLLVTTAELIFASTKQLEIAVRVDEMRLEHGKQMHVARVVDGILTFMSVDPDTGKTRTMPPLKVNTEEQRKLFEERKALYEERKLAREKATSSN